MRISRAVCSRPIWFPRDGAFEYFTMLQGIPGVKTGIMVKRFSSKALSIAGWGTDLTHFEHAIWLSQSQPSED